MRFLRQDYEFEAILNHTVSSGLAWIQSETLSQKDEVKTQCKNNIHSNKIFNPLDLTKQLTSVTEA